MIRDNEPDKPPDDPIQSRQEMPSPTEWAAIAEQLALTCRELDIVKLTLDNNCDSDIADDLSISRHTVHTHFRRLYRKLGVHSRVQLVIVIFQSVLQLRSEPPQSDARHQGR